MAIAAVVWCRALLVSAVVADEVRENQFSTCGSLVGAALGLADLSLGTRFVRGPGCGWLIMSSGESQARHSFRLPKVGAV